MREINKLIVGFYSKGQGVGFLKPSDYERTVKVLMASDSDPVEAVLELSNGGVEFSFEALGRKETAEQCFEMLSPGGVATVIGMVPEGQKVEVLGSELLSEKTLQGSNMGSNQFRIDMPYYVDLYLEGKLKLDFIHEKNIELKDINESFQLLRDSDSGRHTVIFKS